MSLAAMRAALATEGITPTEKLVLVAIGNYARDTGEAWPGIDRLAADTGLGERTVRRALAALETAGALTIERRPGRGNRYRVTAPKLSTTPVTVTAPPVTVTGHPGHSDRTPGHSDRRSFDLTGVRSGYGSNGRAKRELQTLADAELVELCRTLGIATRGRTAGELRTVLAERAQ